MLFSVKQVFVGREAIRAPLKTPVGEGTTYGNHSRDCVVPENIQTPITEGISLRTPPPPWIFHFCRELMTPHPLGISTSVTKTPQPLGKVHFHEERLLK